MSLEKSQYIPTIRRTFDRWTQTQTFLFSEKRSVARKLTNENMFTIRITLSLENSQTKTLPRSENVLLLGDSQTKTFIQSEKRPVAGQLTAEDISTVRRTFFGELGTAAAGLFTGNCHRRSNKALNT